MSEGCLRVLLNWAGRSGRAVGTGQGCCNPACFPLSPAAIWVYVNP